MIIRLVKLLISGLFYLVDCTYKSFRCFLGKPKTTSCVVLYYHAVPGECRERFARQIDAIIASAVPIPLANLDKLSDTGHYVAVTFDDGFQSVLENALPELALRRIPITIFIPTDCLGQSPSWLTESDDSLSKQVVMSVDQLKSLDANLVSLGSHGCTHSNLLLLEEEEARMEIYQSKQCLESHSKRRVDTFAFPYGAFDQRHVKLARQAGYERVFSILPTLATSEYVTGRVPVDPTDWIIEFKLKMRGSYRWLPKAFTLKRKLRHFFVRIHGGSHS
jgi:peptidoglycan/xylan/chitin deacetylase (PgdA/CDA1 family)